MRLMGIDYGTKRVGIALTDESGSMAFPHDTLTNSPALAREVAALARENGVSTIVIGHSKDLRGEDNPVQSEIDRFKKTLEESAHIPVEFELEYYSTKESLRTQGKTEHTDASAAAIILNSYLARTKDTS